MRILLVEDDLSLGSTIQSWLQLDGYAVDWAQRGDHADTALRTHAYECVLLDRGLPGLSGDGLLTRLRGRESFVPVLMVTARDTLRDRIEGLDLGADDYLVKPFDLEELSARIRVATRRAAQRPSTALVHGPIRLDPAGKQVYLDDKPVQLTIREFTVLHALMLRSTHVLSREQLEDALYGWGEEVESNAIEVHIHHLRKKLGGNLIRTVRNAGYTLS
jgi:DNA-binding response OmpR family regulator